MINGKVSAVRGHWGWFIAWAIGMLLLPPSAFFIIGFIIWGMRTFKTDQVERSEFKIAPNTQVKEAH